mgnify:CR=1 FL=1
MFTKTPEKLNLKALNNFDKNKEEEKVSSLNEGG